MKNLFEAATVRGVKVRLADLRPDSERLWSKMSAGQSLAHCSGGMQMAMGPNNIVGDSHRQKHESMQQIQYEMRSG